MARQPELGAIWARDSAGFLLALVPLGFELIDALVQDFQKVGIVDLGGFPIAADRIRTILVIGVQGDNVVGAQRFAIG